MRSSPRSARRPFFILALIVTVISLSISSFPSAYNGRPKLIVVIVVDQLRADYLERYRDEFGDAGFRLFLDHGAYFSNCNYNYANTRTAPGHASLLTGAYTNGHGIADNEWWDPQKKRIVTSVEDDTTKLVGIAGDHTGASPHNLLSDTLGDELRLATQGNAHVFGVALKDRAAVLPAGFSADGAYWIDHKSGTWVTSTYYREDLPQWVQNFNSSRPQKYWDKEWKDSHGTVLASTAHRKAKDGSDLPFYEVVGSTSLGNEYEFEFAKELVVYENVGRGPATDLLTISLSPLDIVGHHLGPDSPEVHQMVLDLDKELADFFNFLGHHIGLANVWVALSADHGVSALPEVANKLRIPGSRVGTAKAEEQINAALTAKFSPGHPTAYVKFRYPLAWLDQDAFAAANVRQHDAEIAVGEAMKQVGLRGYYTKSQLAQGEAPATELGRKYLSSYSPEGSWYVMGVPGIYAVGGVTGTDHASPYNYDTHVPLAIYGLPFQPGTYRTAVEPVDLTPTLASLLGINPPTHSVGRVLTEALAPPHRGSGTREGQP